ncbi:MAG TPA: TonB family protein [Steroidobacteraceae bacterium]
MSQRNERSMPSNSSGLTHWLIHQAAHRTPESLSSRLEEEWLADLESRSAALSRLRFAIGCCWATLVIANDYPRNRAAAASPVAPAVPASGIVTLVDRNFGYFSLRSATLFLIAGLHAALFFGLITSLSHTHKAPVPPDLVNSDVPSVPPTKVPFVSGSVLSHWTITVPKPVVESPPRLNFDNEVTTDISPKPGEITLPPVSSDTPNHAVRRLAGGPGAGFPETADFYPSPSIRWGEEGVTTVQVCVDTRGRLTSGPSTVKGSGSARLDDAALRLARAGSGHYRATTEDGLPVNSCYAFAVRFQLRR